MKVLHNPYAIPLPENSIENTHIMSMGGEIPLARATLVENAASQCRPVGSSLIAQLDRPPRSIPFRLRVIAPYPLEQAVKHSSDVTAQCFFPAQETARSAIRSVA